MTTKPNKNQPHEYAFCGNPFDCVSCLARPLNQQITKDKTPEQKLRLCVEYCRQQNGRDECKNCGLNDEMIDNLLASERQRMRE